MWGFFWFKANDMSEITYILGAGASFQSIPLVGTFNNRLLEFAEFVNGLGQVGFVGEQRNKFIQASEAIKNLYEEFSSHQSFDTYFKKQFHLGNDNAINQGKRLLNMYFTWEHDRSSIIQITGNLEKNNHFYKRALFDKRYDALIAGLLKPYKNTAETLCKINFITWNYDLNLLQSIKNFFAPNLSFKEFIQKIEKPNFYWNINDQISIINVNGHFYSSDYDNFRDLGNLNGRRIIEDKVLDEYFLSPTMDDDANRIKFAWELNESEQQQLLYHINRNVENSQQVVVIGYTFPLYNRIIDSLYMKERLLSAEDKQITIQDPNADNIGSTIIEIMGHSKTFEPLVNKKSDCSSFYVPSNIYISTAETQFPIIKG